MWCGVLGVLDVRGTDGAPIVVSGPARRLLLAALVSRVGHPVRADTLVEQLWGGAPAPRTAAKTLQSHVARLRDDLGRTGAGSPIRTVPGGYCLELDPQDVDAADFERRVGIALADERPEKAIAELDTALGLWRGEAYEDFPDAAFTVPERVRLSELRLVASEHRTELALQLGLAAELVAELERRVDEAPFRERGWEQLIIALYRAGRQADALGAHRRACAVLADGVGLDPGPRLRELEARILHHDPALAPAGPSTSTVVPAVSDGSGPCPYVGLAAYQEVDSALFVGRERLVADLVGRLAEHRVVVVAGASGTGKSSLLRAGLLPALRSGALPGSAAWRCAVTGVTELGGPAADLLVVDQVEEVFTRLDPEERLAVAAALRAVVEADGRLVLAVRGDYYARLAELEPFGGYAQAATLLTGPLRADELRRVIVEPAERVGLTCEPALVEAVLDDVVGQEHALPLVSAALVRTWENRAGTQLTLDGYRRGGGVASALEDTAEDAYRSLDVDARVAARRLFVRLAVLDGERWARRPVRLADHVTAAAVLAAFAQARLVTVSDTAVELTHEALLVSWPRLQGWLADRTLSAALLDHLDGAARAWDAAGRPASDLYRGARLEAVLDWRAGHPEELAPLETAFLAESSAAAGAELARERARADREGRGRRRLRTVAVALAAVVVLAAVAALLAVRARSSADAAARAARRSALIADVQRLAAESATAPDVATASLLAVAAYRLQDSADSRGALLAAVERGDSALWRLAEAHRLVRLAATPDGTRLVMMDNRREVYVVDPRARAVLRHFPSGADEVDGLTPDGRSVITLGRDGRVALLDADTGRRTALLASDADESSATEPVLSHDGRWLAVLTTAHLPGGTAIDVFDVQHPAAPPRRFATARPVAALAVGDHVLATQNDDGTVEVRDLATLQVVLHRTEPANHDQAPLGVSRDGTELAVTDAADPRRVTLVPRTGAPRPLPTQPQGVSRIAFAPGDGEVVLTSYSGSVAVYQVSDGALVETLAGHAGPVIDVAWTGATHPTGLYTVGLDSNLISWSVTSAPRLVTESGADLPSIDRGEIFGHYVLGVTPDQNDAPATSVALYRADLVTGQRSVWPLHLRGGEYVNQAVADRAGDRALLSIEDGAGRNRIEIWDLDRGIRTGLLALPASSPRLFGFGFAAAISPDGRSADVSLGATRIGVFGLPSGRYERGYDLRLGRDVLTVPWQFAPDGTLLAAGTDPAGTAPDQRLARVDAATGRVLAVGHLGDVIAPRNIAWSRDGTLLAVGTYDGSIHLLDARTLHTRATVLAAEPGYVSTVSFAPDGRTLVSAGTAGTVNLWTVPGLRREAPGFAIGNGANNGGLYAWFAPDGDVVGFAPDVDRPQTQDARWFTLPVAPAALIRTACGLAGADITAAQWQRYVGDRPRIRVC